MIRGISFKNLVRLKRRDDGVVAVEFALLALPLFTMILGIVELSMFFASGIVLEGAASEAARQIRIGQVQAAADPEAAFEEELCEKVGVMINCNDLQYEVIHVDEDTFSGAQNQPPQFDENGNLMGSGFNSGNSNDVVIVRAAHRYEFLTPFVGGMIARSTGTNSLMHVATVVIKSEPYNFGEE